jgi:phosphopantetheinyl transferase
MLVFKKQISKEISIAVWQIVETETYFFNSLALLPEDEAKIRKVKLLNVRLQKLACRAALAELTDCNEINITYAESGQPLLRNAHISFSHTKNYVAVALSKTVVGIDIEELKPRILPLYPRFMSRREIEVCEVNNIKELYYFWCAKEAMYKWYVKKNLDFIEDLQVFKNKNKGIICGKHTVQLVNFCVDSLAGIVCY